ncbi:MAG: energy transducer TonB, partial [Thermodesulfobacteriota bacterium]|nr:energy transducer TonB [Thermodesulfobacteriota bacterium]
PPPQYPVLARRRGWQGTVHLSVLVLANGRVGDITIEKSSGYPLLDKTALKAVTRYRFVPGRQGNQPVAMRVQMPVHFRLQDTD